MEKNKYDDIYYVVFSTEDKRSPELSLPLFMSEKEYKDDKFGSFDYQEEVPEELKEKTKKFEKYLGTGDGKKAINAIANKKRVLGLSRMIVGEVNKGGRKTRKKRRTIKKRKNNRKTKRRV